MVDVSKEKKEIVSKCYCTGCPTFLNCGEKGGFCFYAVGKSKCINQKNGCLCPKCPVHVDRKLKRDFYCINGPEILK